MNTDSTIETPLRSAAELVAKAQEPGDVFGFRAEVLCEFLTFEEARPLLLPDAKPDRWDELTVRPTRENVLNKMREYMEFAWDKARNHRALSAGRSVTKLRAWVWVLGEEDAINWGNYKNYGAPILRQICERYGFPIPQRLDIDRMSRGLPCVDGCEEGCGS